MLCVGTAAVAAAAVAWRRHSSSSADAATQRSRSNLRNSPRIVRTRRQISDRATAQKYLELYKNGTTTTTTTTNIATAIVLRPLYRSTQRCPWVHFV